MRHYDFRQLPITDQQRAAIFADSMFDLSLAAGIFTGIFTGMDIPALSM